MSEPEQAEYTIDELAQRTRLTTRNIRAYQSRGLIPAPLRRGRVGYYGPEHIERLELVRELREEGLALDLIQRMMEASGGAREALRFARTVISPYQDVENEIIDLIELANRWKSTDYTVIKRAQTLGILRDLGDGRVEIIDARISEVGLELLGLGVTLDDMLDLLEEVKNAMDGISRTFVAVFEQHVWQPFEQAGRPQEQWKQLTSDVERLRPMADQGVLAIFRVALEDVMSESIDAKLREIESESAHTSATD